MRRRSKMLLLLLAAAVTIGCGGGRLRVLSGFDVVVSMDPLGGRAPVEVAFQAVVIGEEGYDGFEYRWSFGDGTPLDTSEAPVHVYSVPGTYTVTLRLRRLEDGVSLERTALLPISPNSVPTVTPTANPSSGLAPLAVSFDTFVAGGDGALTYQWDFGDGEMSALPGPLHIYQSPGAYDAAVTVVDEDGDTDTAMIAIAVGGDDMPAVSATATPTTGDAPLVVVFDCTVVGGNAPVAVRWDFGDGDAATAPAATHTYASPGTFVSTCVATDANGTQGADSLTITVGEDDTPVAVASVSPAVGPAPLMVSFTGVGIGGDGALTYDWAFGDGNGSPSQSPTHLFSAAGSYQALLTVTDADGDFATDTVTVTVEVPPTVNQPPVAVASIVAGACAVTGQDPVSLDASASSDPEGGAITWSWVFVSVPPGSVATLNDPGVANPSFVPDRDGTYTLRVFVSDGVDTVASSTLSITASGPTLANILSGDNQMAAAATAFSMPLQIQLLNACGAPVVGAAVQWAATDATVASSTTVTGALGDSTNDLTAGTVAGPVTVDAVVAGGPAAASFTNLTVVAGPAAELLMNLPPDSSLVTGMPLTFAVYDAYGNPVTTTDVTFDVCVVSGLASFVAPLGPVCEVVTTSGGVGSTTAFNIIPETVFFEIFNPVPPLSVGARVNVLDDDLEGGDDGGWLLSVSGTPESWELGAPANVGPVSGFSGNNVWGTDLDANYSLATTFGSSEVTVLERAIDFSLLISGIGPPPLEVILSEQELYDVHPDQALCPSPGGMISLGACGAGSCLVPPDRGFDAFDCAWGDGNSGASGDWEPVTYDLTAFGAGGTLDLTWALVRGSASTTGAGWYLDDISVDVKLQWIPGTFVP